MQALHGNAANGLEAVTWSERSTRREQTHDIRNVFLFIGADPEVGSLGACQVGVDESGFVVTGTRADANRAASGLPPALELETSLPGVFAVGDVRSGSVKRVGGAIGDGAAVVPQIHRLLAQASQER